MFEQFLEKINVFKCSQCLECKIASKPDEDDLDYVYGKCVTRNVRIFFSIRKNLHAVWYLVDNDRNQVQNANGNKVPQFHIPEELSLLSMHEELLIHRCASSIHAMH